MSKKKNFKKKREFIRNNFSLSEEQIKKVFDIGEKLNLHKYNVWLAKEAQKDPSILEDYKTISNIIDWVRDQKVNILQYDFQQALEKQKEWHQNIGSKIRKKVENNEIDQKRVLYTTKDGKFFFYILNEEDLDYEGGKMEHCIANSGIYKEKLKDDVSMIVSIRDENNIPNATIEINKEDNLAQQISGKRNGKIPDKVNKAIIEFFITTNSIDYIEDKEMYNIIHNNLKN